MRRGLRQQLQLRLRHTPIVTPVAFSTAAIMVATRASISNVLLTIPAPQRTSLVWPIMGHTRWPAKPTAPHACTPSTPHPTPRVCPRAAGTPFPTLSSCTSDGHLEPVNSQLAINVGDYPGCTKLGSCDESWSVRPNRAPAPLHSVPLCQRSITAACLPAATPSLGAAATPTATGGATCPACLAIIINQLASQLASY